MIYGFKKEKAETLSAIAELHQNSVTNAKEKTGLESVFVTTPSAGIAAASNGESGKASCDVMHISNAGVLTTGTFKLEVHNISDSSIAGSEIVRCYFVKNKWIASLAALGQSPGTCITVYSTAEIAAFNATTQTATGVLCNEGVWTENTSTNVATIANKTESDGSGGTQNVQHRVYNVDKDNAIPNGIWFLAYKKDGLYFAMGVE